MQDKHRDWNDPLIIGRRRVLTHTPLGAYPDADAARKGLPSPYVVSLNGTWRFQLTSSPDNLPAESGDWLDMPVPSNWQLDPRVDDQPIYTNMPYPFEATPPAVPDINPTGWYRTTFKVPAAWTDRDIFILFESCDSACQVWVNGTEAGYSQDSKLPHEFNISALVKGENELSVMVPRYCDGFWLECQDYWHLSGIQRDVTLYSKPHAHIRDFTVRTTFDADFRNATLDATVYMSDVEDLGDGYTVEVQLFDAHDQPLFTEARSASVATESPMYSGTASERTAASFSLPVNTPHLWSAESPYLYTLVMTLKNASGEAIDFERSRVGFRQVEIADGILKLNGKRLIVRGTNDHEHHPERGRALTRDDMVAEIVAMKKLNFNAIRTSHYPHHSAFYDVCDELGMYVVDEANLETHGVGALLSKDPLWMNAYLERAQRMALRDRNHPCVLTWSLGNESYYGPHHAAMHAWLRACDPTRPVQYESGFPGPDVSDIMAPMYPRMHWLHEIFADQSETRPLIMCEYAYSKGNANGNVTKYWDMIDTYPCFQGGFVWDWRDKALVREIDGKPEWAYGNEFDGGIGPDGFNYGVRENPQMCLNGVVNPDLTPKPGAYELKHAQAPVQFIAEDLSLDDPVSIAVWNKYLALDLSHLEFAWKLTVDGERVEGGTLDVPSTAPGARVDVQLPLRITGPMRGEYFLNVHARQTEATAWCDAGHTIAQAQFPVRLSIGSAAPTWDGSPEPSSAHAPLRLTKSPTRYELQGAGFALHFNRLHGCIDEYRVGDTAVLSRPLEHCFMRARTDNDYITGNPGSYYSQWIEAGVDRLRAEVIECEAAPLTDTQYLLTCTTRHRADGLEAGVQCRTNYLVDSSGRLRVDVEVDASALQLLTLPRVGMRMAVSPQLSDLSWYGRGPHEAYRDRTASALVGTYESTVEDQFFPFVDPCECGGHADTRWMRLTDEASGMQLTFTGQPRFQFSALNYAMEDLLQAGHVYELTRDDDVHVHVDGYHMGLGGDTGWTRNVHPEFLLPPGVYRYGFTLAAGRPEA